MPCSKPYCKDPNQFKDKLRTSQHYLEWLWLGWVYGMESGIFNKDSNKDSLFFIFRKLIEVCQSHKRCGNMLKIMWETCGRTLEWSKNCRWPSLFLFYSSSIRVNLRVLQCFHLKGSQSPEILIANGKPSEIPFQSNLIET